jgi:hypothetical protein
LFEENYFVVMTEPVEALFPVQFCASIVDVLNMVESKKTSIPKGCYENNRV